MVFENNWMMTKLSKIDIFHFYLTKASAAKQKPFGILQQASSRERDEHLEILLKPLVTPLSLDHLANFFK